MKDALSSNLREWLMFLLSIVAKYFSYGEDFFGSCAASIVNLTGDKYASFSDKEFWCQVVWGAASHPPPIFGWKPWRWDKFTKTELPEEKSAKAWGRWNQGYNGKWIKKTSFDMLGWKGRSDCRCSRRKSRIRGQVFYCYVYMGYYQPKAG